MDLTERQRKIVEFLRAYTREHGYPPTMREIGGHFGFTWPAARGHLAALERKGAVRLNPFRSRGIEVLNPRGRDAIELPVAGRIRAGRPVLAVEDIEEHILVDRELFRERNAFVLRITGDSMAEAGILDGDYVVVRPQKDIRSGEIGVVLIGEEATVKRVSVRKGTITLIPANRAFKPLTYPAGEVKVAGKVIGVIRRLP